MQNIKQNHTLQKDSIMLPALNSTQCENITKYPHLTKILYSTQFHLRLLNQSDFKTGNCVKSQTTTKSQ